MADTQGFGPPVVEAVDVHHHYGEGPQRVDVLFDINMQVREGELVIVTGPSGSGKTTLLTILGTMRKPSEGKLRLLGTDIVGLGGSDLDVLRNRIRFTPTATDQEFSAVFQAASAAWRRRSISSLIEASFSMYVSLDAMYASGW